MKDRGMKLGFYGNYTPQAAEFAQKTGFRCMELSAWPKSALNADTVSREALYALQKDLEARNIEISALGYYPNHLSANQKEAEEARRYFVKLLDLAKRMGVRTVGTFAGRNQELSVEDNLPLFQELFSFYCDIAAQNGVRIAIENCPMMDNKTMRGENIAFSPEIWQEMFRVVPAENLGLEFDPSHLCWMGIDYVQAALDFGPKIFHVHAKDVEVRPEILKRTGIYGQLFNKDKSFGHGWWRPRAPGWGDINWVKFMSALIQTGYKGNLDIEHEDDVFAGAADLHIVFTEETDIINNYGAEENGLILGYKALIGLIPN
jgi:sugar phosphate isomerase/epimerase